jgi:hypothetical protein
MNLSTRWGALALFCTLCFSAEARLLDEVQVYDDAINDPGEFGVELHINLSPSGISRPNYPGEITNVHGLRTTFELAYASSESIEWGLYLPFVHTAAGDERFAGPKARVKYIAKKASDESPWLYGINIELDRVKQAFDEGQSLIEARPILGWKKGGWAFTFNPVISEPLQAGYRQGGPSFSPQFKVSKEVASGVATGFEYYADLGQFSHFDAYSNQSHTLYWAVDVDRKPFVFSVGIGRGLTAASDRWTVKALIELPFD